MADPVAFTRKITYGGYEFDYTRLKVDSRNILSTADDGKTQTHTRTTFRISGFLIGADEDGFAVELLAFRSALAVPRQNFLVKEGDIELYKIDFSTRDKTQTDVIYGPNVEDFSIDRFYGGISCSYSATIIVDEKICGAAGTDAPNEVLQITKAYTYSIEGSGFTTRTVTGVLVVTQQAKAPDRYRKLVYVPVPNGYKRQRQEYRTEADGRTLSYTIVDKEIYRTLPTDLTEGDAEFTIDTRKGHKIVLILSGRFEVSNKDSKTLAIKHILLLLDKYFGPHMGAGSGTFAFTKQTLKTGIYCNYVDFYFSGFTSGKIAYRRDKQGRNVFSDLIRTPPASTGTSKHIGQGTLSDGTRPIDDACSGIEGYTRRTTTNLSSTYITQPREIGAIYPGGTPATTEAIRRDTSQEHQEYLYLDYNEKISYEVASNRKIFRPKKRGIAPIVQQTDDPIVRIVQTGYAVRYNKNPDVPGPVVTPPHGYVLQESIETQTPELEDDSKIYTSSWRYIIEVVQDSYKLQNIHAPGGDPRLKNRTEKLSMNIPKYMQLEHL